METMVSNFYRVPKMGAHLCPKLKNGLFEQKEASNHIFYEIKVVWHPQNGDQMKSDLTSEAV